MKKAFSFITLVLLDLCLANTSSQAALGWTLVQCKHYYGAYSAAPQSTIGNRTIYFFKSKRFTVGTIFINGTDAASRIIYSKDGKNVNIGPEVIEQLIIANLDSTFTMSEPIKARDALRWNVVNGKGDLFYCANYNDGVFSIWNQADQNAIDINKQAEVEAEQL